ncbi:MAG: HEAT repeat domain-containing protein [Bacillota bacterium]
MQFGNNFDFAEALRALQDPWDPDRRLAAAASISRWLAEAVATPEQVGEALAAHPDLVGSLVQALGDRHKGVQVHAAECLEVLAHFSPEVVPALRSALQSGDPWHAWAAAIVLARLNLWWPEMGPALAGAMGSRNRDLRWAAASLVLRLAERYGRPLADLAMAAARDPDPVRRKMAGYLVGEMGRRQYLEAEPVLLPLLEDPEPEVRRAGILALNRQPSLSPAARERLGQIAGADPDPFVRRTAAAVLSRRPA